MALDPKTPGRIFPINATAYQMAGDYQGQLGMWNQLGRKWGIGEHVQFDGELHLFAVRTLAGELIDYVTAAPADVVAVL